jgi:hypothetical protein
LLAGRSGAEAPGDHDEKEHTMARKASNKAREAQEPTTVVDPTCEPPKAAKATREPVAEAVTVEDLSHLDGPTGKAKQSDNVTTTDLTHTRGPTGLAQQRTEPQVFTEGGMFVGTKPSPEKGVVVRKASNKGVAR